jgi:Domain of unknown function (DUF4919)
LPAPWTDGNDYMLRRIAILVLLLISLPAAATSDADSRYRNLLTAAKSGQPVDWQALRFAYAEGSGFDLLGTKSAETRKAMNEALQSNDYAGALVHANLILDQNYVDIDAHVIIDIANTKLGNADEAKKHHSIVIGLLQSIRTGDGKTPETAFTVITVHEEYSLIRIFGLRRQSQALIADGGHHYDVLDVVNKEGQSQKLYFQVDRVLAAEAALLKGKR